MFRLVERGIEQDHEHEDQDDKDDCWPHKTNPVAFSGGAEEAEESDGYAATAEEPPPQQAEENEPALACGRQ